MFLTKSSEFHFEGHQLKMSRANQCFTTSSVLHGSSGTRANALLCLRSILAPWLRLPSGTTLAHDRILGQSLLIWPISPHLKHPLVVLQQTPQCAFPQVLQIGTWLFWLLFPWLLFPVLPPFVVIPPPVRRPRVQFLNLMSSLPLLPC